MRLFLVCLVIVSMILAGCTGDPGPGEAASDDGPDDPGRGTNDAGSPYPDDPVAEAPDWQPGDWWRWGVGPRDAGDYEATTAVVSADASSFLIGWDTIDEGLRSQFFHFIPHGAVARPAFTWEAHHEPVTWFDFPIQDGKMWNGSFWSADLAFSAAAAEVAAPQGPVAGFQVTGENEDRGVRVEYDWATDLQIFTVLRVYLRGDVPWITLDLLEHGTGRTDPVQVLHSEMSTATFTSIERTTDSTPPLPPGGPLEIPAGVTHVSIGCYLGGPPGHYEYRLTDSAGTSHVCEAELASEWFGLVLAYGPVAPGDALSAFTTAGQGSVFAEVFLVTVEERVPG